MGLLLIVAGLNASKAGTRFDGCPEGCATADERREGPLRVMTLNVLHGFPRFEHLSQRLGLIAGEIRRLEADIVCLQEVPWRLRGGNSARYLAERTGMNYLYLRANGNRRVILFEEGETILSRYPLRDAAFTELEPQAGFFEHRVVLHATAVTSWGEVRIFCTHLTNGGPEVNRAQATALTSFVATTGSGPAIVAGDFNATENSPQMEAIRREWIDTYLAVHPDDTGFTCCIDDLTQAPGEPLEKRIDYLFLVPGANQAARVISSQRVLDRPFPAAWGWQWASDHVGLLAVIEVGR